uniref:ATP synthase F0 subunit a n=1 Tax=Diplonema sp. ATCC 50224 TaxID=91375 RepID=A0A2D2AJX4_9EUGL|nr:ATP synthase F0 subunit a [Diplonema sp. ATCC 50224]
MEVCISAVLCISVITSSKCIATMLTTVSNNTLHNITAMSYGVTTAMTSAACNDTDTCSTMLITSISLTLAHCISSLLLTISTRSLSPLGTLVIGAGLPVALRCALCAIEGFSTSFRSVSLALRITANSAAAHILLSTLIDMSSTHMSSSCYGIASMSTLIVLPLLLLKLVTCVVQGVVLVRLLAVYWKEQCF